MSNTSTKLIAGVQRVIQTQSERVGYMSPQELNRYLFKLDLSAAELDLCGLSDLPIPLLSLTEALNYANAISIDDYFIAYFNYNASESGTLSASTQLDSGAQLDFNFDEKSLSDAHYIGNKTWSVKIVSNNKSYEYLIQLYHFI